MVVKVTMLSETSCAQKDRCLISSNYVQSEDIGPLKVDSSYEKLWSMSAKEKKNKYRYTERFSRWVLSRSKVTAVNNNITSVSKESDSTISKVLLVF